MENFDFDAWAELARTAPEVFEQQRRDTVEALIERLRASDLSLQRLHGMQYRINLERRRTRTPLQACIRLLH